MLTLSHVLEALTGYQSGGGTQVITDVVIDSRLTIPGALFIALPGEHTDGHSYVAAAFDKGASAALVQRDLDRPPEGGQARWQTLDLREPVTYAQLVGLDGPVCLRVDDTLKAMQTLAAFWRGRLNPRVIGVTGSVGKTTTKELVAAVLSTRYRTLKSEGNFNNEIGLPLMLLNSPRAMSAPCWRWGFTSPARSSSYVSWPARRWGW